jgi:hypothetical protein
VVKNGISAKLPQAFKAAHCSELSYRIKVPKNKFDVVRFTDALSPFGKSSRWNTVLLVPNNSDNPDYHAHVFWKTDSDPEKIRLQVDYHIWPPETEGKNDGPFADTFFDWANQFISSESELAHVHAEFEYPVKKWRSNIMVLPIKVPIGSKSATIEGLSIKLPVESHGVTQVWLLRGNKYFTLQMFADRPIVFKNFTPQADVDAFTSAAMSLIEEIKS